MPSTSLTAFRRQMRIRGRKGSQWVWRCALAAATATAALRAVAFISSSPGAARPRSTTAQTTRQAAIDEVMNDVKTRAAELAPDRIQANAVEALDNLATDDGRALDTSAPSGAVGAFAVSLAALPYIPISLYSSYTLATTGKGLDAGPNGIYGLAEGLATLVVLAIALWSTASFFTRARGLPAGPFNLLGVTQAFAYLSTLTLAGALYLNSVPPAQNPMRGFPVAADKLKKDFQKDPTGTVIRATEAPRKEISDAAKVASTEAGKAFDSASKSASQAASDLQASIKMPDVKVPAFKVPDMTLPDFKALKRPAPSVKKLDEVEAKAPPSPSATSPEVTPVPAPIAAKEKAPVVEAVAAKEAVPSTPPAPVVEVVAAKEAVPSTPPASAVEAVAAKKAAPSTPPAPTSADYQDLFE